MRKMWLFGACIAVVLLGVVVQGATTVNGHSVPTYSDWNSTGKELAQQRIIDILTDAATAIDTDGKLDAATAAAGDLTVEGKITCDTLVGVLRSTGANVYVNGILNCDTIAGTLTATGDATVQGVLSCQIDYSDIVTNTDGSETLAYSQSGALVLATKSDGTTTITLPNPASSTVGNVFYLLQTADQNLEVVPTTGDGNSLVADGVATSDKVSCATSSHKIGAGMIVIGISATQWYVGALNPACPLTVEAAD